MDKLKIIIGDLKKYQFWLLCGAVLVISLVCWWLSTSGMKTQFKARKTVIDNSFSSVTTPSELPNADKIAEVKHQTEKLKEGIYPAWEILYKQQKEANQLPEKLGKEFKAEFERIKPGGDLASKYREIYQTYIKGELTSLRSIIKARHLASDAQSGEDRRAAGSSHRGGGNQLAGMAATAGAGHSGDRSDGDSTGIVAWDDADYGKWEDRFQWDEIPSTAAIVLAQEDLWICEALLRAIARTNGSASNQSSAVVKRVESLEIGASAVEAWKASNTSLGLAAAGGGASAPPAIAPSVGPGGPPGGPSDEQVRQKLYQNRYVDDKGAPLAYDASSPLCVKHPFAEFKLMPICMKLMVDGKQLPKLLAECANSKMPMEIRRVRIEPSGGSSTSSPKTAATASTGTIAPRGDGGGHKDSEAPQQTAEHSGVEVEVHAVMYIFNPPDGEKLGKKASDATAMPGGAPAPAANKP
ncbi:MAG: hypothetical protein LLG00_16840 [Planctomycetaceae bacterium]|nr:hypothetical protein [Planctomycetaceae bacterium]